MRARGSHRANRPKAKVIRDADGVRTKFGVNPELIPDYLALVGDSADGYPGIPGIGPKGAAALITRYGAIELFPSQVLGEQHRLALLFKVLATLRTDAKLFADVNELEWRGPTAGFPTVCERLELREKRGIDSISRFVAVPKPVAEGLDNVIGGDA